METGRRRRRRRRGGAAGTDGGDGAGDVGAEDEGVAGDVDAAVLDLVVDGVGGGGAVAD